MLETLDRDKNRNINGCWSRLEAGVPLFDVQLSAAHAVENMEQALRNNGRVEIQRNELTPQAAPLLAGQNLAEKDPDDPDMELQVPAAFQMPVQLATDDWPVIIPLVPGIAPRDEGASLG